MHHLRFQSPAWRRARGFSIRRMREEGEKERLRSLALLASRVYFSRAPLQLALQLSEDQ